MKLAFTAIAALMGVIVATQQSVAVPILGPSDLIIAIDSDGEQPTSGYPGAEAPSFAVDGSLSKYLNFGGGNSGLIVTPAFGASTAQSLQLTTANDAPDRDPLSFALYGTNDAIASVDNGTGLAESWTLIDGYDLTGGFALPPERDTLGPVVPLTNASSYTSYKLLFPTVNGSNLMQIAEVSLFESIDATGADIFEAGDVVLGIDEDTAPDSNFPGGEPPSAAIDRDAGTKYLNFGQVNSGFIVTPASGPEAVRSFRITTANDADARDPAAFELYGTNDVISSAENSDGNAEAWTLVDSGMISLPTDRNALGDAVVVSNDTAYTSYKMIFTDLRDPGGANSMQISEVQFYSTVVPEPSAVGLVLLSCLAGVRVARGRRV